MEAALRLILIVKRLVFSIMKMRINIWIDRSYIINKINPAAISSNKLSLSINEEKQLNMNGTTDTITWTSSDKFIATVNQEGLVINRRNKKS